MFELILLDKQNKIKNECYYCEEVLEKDTTIVLAKTRRGTFIPFCNFKCLVEYINNPPQPIKMDKNGIF